MKVVNFIFAAFLLVLVSCGNPKSELVGTWKVVDVETDFDEEKMSPAMILQVIDMQKETFFKINNDSVLIVFTKENTHEAKWDFNDDDQTISYFFETSPTTINKLGTYVDGEIVSETTSAIGKMVVTYGKQEK
ncbi:MAG: hypothetical protein C0598_11630 [Marinilabiliales bacterium]|nr:MAG: hypothetical protein C0598_11630 [Marinilabiliales bacterium]